MDLRPLSESHSVAPMLEPADMAILAERGATAIICNRPDAEVPPGHRAADMQAAAEAAGMAFTFNPVAMPGLTVDAIEEQANAIEAASGLTVAYCASGTRSAILWALAMAGRMPTDEIMAALDQAGYPMPGLRTQIETMAQR
ncbi:TIGR01244 family sulfur transferase [Jannaschia aquimarina]|uniref:Blh_2 protein n=1 Tax=Jannaschia aquimarina TaxID=935700 RepID=A0A0D1EE82_9RHOB|nr:TIGR01244 family sulfur transferase [Jannaschia aquimarina]KIT16009.1 Beta-lactamase hydrolase-like protein [Jannaschia aquimarina]SNS99975.1 TIGR01244 family protein [Jannaschia aquimarina]